MTEADIPTFRAQIRALEPGETVSKVRRFSLDQAAYENFNKVLLDMRRSINTAASRCSEATGYELRVESGVMLTADKDALLAVVAVTRP